jgi:hypothetical protein
MEWRAGLENAHERYERRLRELTAQEAWSLRTGQNELRDKYLNPDIPDIVLSQWFESLRPDPAAVAQPAFRGSFRSDPYRVNRKLCERSPREPTDRG